MSCSENSGIRQFRQRYEVERERGVAGINGGGTSVAEDEEDEDDDEAVEVVAEGDVGGEREGVSVEVDEEASTSLSVVDKAESDVVVDDEVEEE